MVYSDRFGRKINRKNTLQDCYKIKNGLIQSRRCSDCKEFKDISEFSYCKRKNSKKYSTHNGSIGYFWCRCKECQIIVNHDVIYPAKKAANAKRGKDRKSRDVSYTIVDGTVCLPCRRCKENRLASDYYEDSRICKPCCQKRQLEVNARIRGSEYLRRCWQRYGAYSKEFMQLQNTKWGSDFTALCKVLDLHTHRRVSSQKSKTLFYNVFRLRRDEREAAKEQQTLQGKNKGQFRAAETPML